MIQTTSYSLAYCLVIQQAVVLTANPNIGLLQGENLTKISEYQRIFACPVIFGCAENALVFNRSMRTVFRGLIKIGSRFGQYWAMRIVHVLLDGIFHGLYDCAHILSSSLKTGRISCKETCPIFIPIL